MEEKFARFSGEQKSSFKILLSGISYCDESYHIVRKSGDCYVFEYIIKGRGTVRFGNEEFYPSTGDVYILKPGQRHDYFSSADDPWTKIWINLSGDYVRHLLYDFGMNEISHIKSYFKPDCFYKFYNILLGGQSSEIKYKTVALALCELIYDLSCFCRPAKADSTAAKIKAYIDENYDKNLSLKSMSKLVYLSESRVINIFKKAYGCTPYAYLMSRKVETAQILLSTTTLNIGEISEKLAFCDAHHFSNYFKSVTGLSPKDYKNSLK